MIEFDYYDLVMVISPSNYTVWLMGDGSPLHTACLLHLLCNTIRRSNVKSTYSRHVICSLFCTFYKSFKYAVIISLLFGRNEYLLLLCLNLHSPLYYKKGLWACTGCVLFFYWVFPQLCPGSLIISTDLNHYLSQGLTALSVNISMQTDTRESEWTCNTVI